MKRENIRKAAAAVSAAVMLTFTACSDDRFLWGPDAVLSEGSVSDTSSADSADDSSEADSSEPEESSKDESSEDDSSEDESSEDESYPDDSKTKKDETGLYDTTPISQAYLTGDDSELDDLQKAILKKAEGILRETVTEDMSPVEKELAVHDYICRMFHYDMLSLDAMHSMQPHSDDPYGMLVMGRGICAGYSTSFKLFMDMLEIENMIVHATANDGDEHAWNMVKFGDDWYCVDVTWDDLGQDDPDRFVSHLYFNCTEALLLKHSHQWDMSKIPHANGTEYSFANQFYTEVSSPAELKAAIEKAVERGHNTVCLKGKGDYAEKLDIRKTGRMESDADKIMRELRGYGYAEAVEGDILVYNIQY